jgi:hypothetical protein
MSARVQNVGTINGSDLEYWDRELDWGIVIIQSAPEVARHFFFGQSVVQKSGNKDSWWLVPKFNLENECKFSVKS